MGKFEEIKEIPKFGSLVQFNSNSIAEEYDEVLRDVMAAYVGKWGLGKPTIGKVKELNVQQSTRTIVESNDNGKGVNRPTFEVDLPGAKLGEVCLRFAPEPSGYLHIGHSKAALLNQYFAQQYNGRLIIRFDDTNPSKESNEFVENLLKDIETPGIKYDTVTYTSDYFPQLMEMAESLILKGKAYVDDTPREQMQKERMDGIESKCRSNSIEKNIELWREMIAWV